MQTPPKTFDEGLPRYAQAIRLAYQEERDIPKALQKVAELRAFLLTLPTSCGISKHFRLDNIETKTLAQHAAVPETAVSGDSHD